MIGGYDDFCGLGEKPNNKGQYERNFIYPPIKMSFDSSSLLSHSAYHEHSVLITRYCSLKGIGNNFEQQICHNLGRSCANHFTDFSIEDDSGNQLTPLSAVCTGYGTLYMLSKNSRRHLALFGKDKKDDNSSFLDIGNHQPVALFGGHVKLAAIDSEGEVILINHYPSTKTFKLHIATVSLPDGKKHRALRAVMTHFLF